MEKKRSIRAVRAGVLAFWATVALSIQLPEVLLESTKGIQGFLKLLRSEMPAMDMMHTLLFFAILGLIWRNEDRSDKTACVVSCILAGIATAGMSLAKYKDFSFILFSKKQMLIAALVFFGYWIVLQEMLIFLYGKLDSGVLRTGERAGFTQEQFGRLSVLVLLICWLPLESVYFPGSVPHDTRAQLNMYFGYWNLDAHHPFLSTLFLGGLYRLGQLLLGKNAVAFCIAFQNVLGILMFSRICAYIYRKSKSIVLAGSALLFYALFPAWWTYMQAYIKDSLYFVAVSWYALVYIKCCFHDTPRHAGIQLAAAGFMACFLRFNGAALIFPSLLLLLAREKKRIVVPVLCILGVAYVAVYHFIAPLCVEEQGHRSESLTVPLQQIGRFVSKYEDELSDEEKAVIDNVVVYENMAQRYDPDISDPIKNRYRDATDEDWSAFFQLWYEKFFVHPLTYIEATSNHVYGYLYPFYCQNVLGAYQLYNKGSLDELDADVVYSEYATSSAARDTVSLCLDLWKNLPVLSILINPGFYAWILIASIGAAVRKGDRRVWMFFVLPALNIICCSLSPVNGLMRYALPTMALMPLYVFAGVIAYCEPKMQSTERAAAPIPENTDHY